jgi:sterol desaturase/sphingolipid hydroxylase (fatty acid hydroxylase superfamily)
MSAENAALYTALVLLGSNFLGFIYTYIVLNTNLLAKFRIQNKPYHKGIFWKRMPLFLFNLSTLIALSAFGAYFMFDYFQTEWPSWWVIILQVLLAFIIDDLWFYFYHRYLHENKFLLKHVHSIHHRATTPFPLEYLYAHPLEWMTGALGPVLGFGIISLFMPMNIFAFWIFGVLRNLHEIHIHSDLNLPILSEMPILSKTKHHDDHHAKLNGNYASTFNWMDRLFKTQLKDN